MVREHLCGRKKVDEGKISFVEGKMQGKQISTRGFQDSAEMGLQFEESVIATRAPGSNLCDCGEQAPSLLLSSFSGKQEGSQRRSLQPIKLNVEIFESSTIEIESKIEVFESYIKGREQN